MQPTSIDISNYLYKTLDSMPVFKAKEDIQLFNDFNTNPAAVPTEKHTNNGEFTYFYTPAPTIVDTEPKIFGIFNNTNFFSNWHFEMPKINFPIFGNNIFLDRFTIHKPTDVAIPRPEIKIDKETNLPKTHDINLQQLTDIGYDAQKGKKIAKEVQKKAHGFNGNCGKYVGNALIRAGVFNITEGRDGYKYPNLLAGNPNFKEISTKNVDLSKLPAGCILSYDKGVAGYNKNAGHVEITLGNGQAASDGITNKIKNGARVFVPVKTQLA